MKKLFFAICFNLMFITTVCARVTPISGYENIKPQQQQNQVPEVKIVDYDEFKGFIQERFSKAPTTSKSNINKNFDYVKTSLQQQKAEENKKGFFEKIYDQAISRIQQATDVERQDVAIAPKIDTTIAEQETSWQQSNYPTITVNLPPYYTPFTIPALEHIPYLMNSIEILPNGLVKFEETVTVVANAQKLKEGLTKILPLKTYSPEGKSKYLDYSIISVSVNNAPIEYNLTSNKDYVLLVPQKGYRLTPGIYTYKFEYLVDNLLWEYDDFYRFYWDVGGNGWNLVVDRLGASVALPKVDSLLRNNVLLGTPKYLQTNIVDINTNGPSALAYVAKRPLFIGEGMHIITDIDKKSLFTPTIWQCIVRSFYNYGDIYLSLLGLWTIVVSFVISWRYILKGNSKNRRISLNKTAMVIRYLLHDRFDIKSVGGFMLELYKKNIIDIQQAGDTILLIKRTDNLKYLNKFEQVAMKDLFPSHETTFNVNKHNILPLKRFSSKLEKGLKKQMLKFRLKLNSGYLLFSLAMLVLTELFISIFKINTIHTFIILLCSTLICLLGAFLWQIGKKLWQKITCKLLAIDIGVLSLVIMSAVIHPLAALLIIASILTIFIALGVYSKRLGLIREYIEDIESFKKHIIQHHDNIILGKSFLNHQAAIWAFDLENDFVPVGNPEYNKLPIMQNIIKCFS